jgi:hypothetical protein
MDWIVWLLAAYGLVGLCLVVAGPASTALAQETSRLDGNGATDVQIAFFQVAVSLGIIVAWPLLVPSAYFKLVREARKPPSMLDLLTEVTAGLTADGIETDTFPDGVGSFGLSVDNPIPLNGPRGIAEYFQSLRTLEMETIKYSRLGSFASKATTQPVDAFSVADLRGVWIATLYASIYQKRTSELAPDGFVRLEASTGRVLSRGARPVRPDEDLEAKQMEKPAIAPDLSQEHGLPAVPPHPVRGHQAYEEAPRVSALRQEEPGPSPTLRLEGITIFALQNLYGVGIPTDLPSGERLLAEAAAAGYVPAQHLIATLHWRGDLAAPSALLARAWLGKASAEGHAAAAAMLDGMPRQLNEEYKLASTIAPSESIPNKDQLSKQAPDSSSHFGLKIKAKGRSQI